MYFGFQEEDQLTSGLGHCAELCILLHPPVCFNVRRTALWGQHPSHIYWNRKECCLLHLCFVCFWSSAASYEFQECFSIYVKCISAVFDRDCTESVSCFGFLTIAVIIILLGLKHRNFISVYYLLLILCIIALISLISVCLFNFHVEICSYVSVFGKKRCVNFQISCSKGIVGS